MSQRRSSFSAVLVLLASCSSAQPEGTVSEGEVARPAPTVAAVPLPQVEVEPVVHVAPAPDQAGDHEDLAITRAIQEGIVADAALPLSAHAVVVLSRGAMVTLSGEVGTDEERTAIERIAWDAVGVRAVENRITLSH